VNLLQIPVLGAQCELSELDRVQWKKLEHCPGGHL
jgi:hypothetical protein